MPGSKLASKSPWNRCFKKVSHAQILKLHGIAYVQEECFHTWEHQMFARIRLQLHSTVHVSGVEKYLPLRSADFFRFADSFRSAIRDSQQPTSPIGFLFLKPRRAERRPTTSKNNKKGSLPTRLRNHIRN